ncbi:hypothetical protein [Porphyromonas sp.]
MDLKAINSDPLSVVMECNKPILEAFPSMIGIAKRAFWVEETPVFEIMNTVYSFVLCRSLPQTIDNLGQPGEVMLLLISVKLSRKGDNPLFINSIPIECVAPPSDKRDNKENHPFYSLGDRRMISSLQPISEGGR